MRITAFIGSLLLAMSAAPVQAVNSANPINQMIRDHSPPSEFYLFNSANDKQMNFKTPKTVKLCAKPNKHMTNLMVKHDGEDSIVKPGRCDTFTARNFEISPDGTIQDDYGLVGNVKKEG